MNVTFDSFEVISIPYGAIKSNGAFNCPNLTTVFQFLMVRLKEILLLIIVLVVKISIPYGAIKSRYVFTNICSRL